MARGDSRLERADGVPIEQAHADAKGDRIFLGPEWQPHERESDGGTTMVRRPSKDEETDPRTDG